jgi:ABC-type uncharacterized transport system ATPase subunit
MRTRPVANRPEGRACPGAHRPRGIVGVIGPNGVGKTTLLKMILGEEEPDAGTVKLGETVRVSEIPSRAYVAAFGFKGSDQQKPQDARQIGAYESAGAAAAALARACGKGTGRSRSA